MSASLSLPQAVQILILESSTVKNFDGHNRRCVLIDFERLSSRCDVSGFISSGELQAYFNEGA